jgi:parvulin-like peptidyl-prolyl isomerase
MERKPVMRKHAPRLHIFAFAALLLAVCVAGCGREKKEAVARVNQQPITQRQLWEALERADNGEAGRRTLDALIVRQLVRQEARKRDIEVSAEELARRMEGLKDYILAATGKDFQTWLDETGQTEDEVAGRISVQVLTGKLVLTPDDRERFFEQNKERLADLPHNNESVIYREIVVASREEADAVREQLLESASDGVVSGSDFAEVAEARSLDPLSARRGGMAGWTVKGKSSDPNLEEALFDLEPGHIGEPIPVRSAEAQAEPSEGESGAQEQQPRFWRIVMVEKYIPPHEITLEDNADVIEEWMLNDPQFQLQLQEFFTNLRARADIEILAPRYRSLGERYRAGREARERRLSTPAPTNLVPLAPEPGGDQPAAPEAPPPAAGQ